MEQAIDGRLKWFVARPLHEFEEHRAASAARLESRDFDVARVQAG